MRLGVSPAAAPTSTGIFNQRFEALFPPCWSPGWRGLLRSPLFVRFIYVRMWGCDVLPTLCLPCSPPLRVRPSRFICANVWSQGLLVLDCLPWSSHVPHSASLGPARATRVLSALVPVSAPSTGLDECLFIYLVSDFLAVRFSVSSGCARRRSVSTCLLYTSDAADEHRDV